MKLEIKLISKECIKPSSPTPTHLKTYKISLLDQFMTPGYYNPFLIFYSNQDTNLANNDFIITKRSQLLKSSLSEILTYYYPLAGKIKDYLSIDCNDEGAYYVEARSNIPLSEYLAHPDLISMNQLVPISATEGSEYFVLMIQETTFSCGSIAITVKTSHMIVDGGVLVAFIKAWGAIATKSSRKETIISLNYDAPSIFPQYHPYPTDANMAAVLENVPRIKKHAAGRFVFDASAIASLKIRATSSSVQNPTGAEVVCAFLGERIINVVKGRSDMTRKIIFTHAVNLRRSALLPENSLGNFIWLAAAVIKEARLPSIVGKMREALRKIDSKFVKEIQGNGGFFKFYEKVKEIKKEFSMEIEHIQFSSICNFGVYNFDFGWGKPLWTGFVFPAVDFPLIMLLDAKMDKGIEALVFLAEEDMAVLEKDKELLAYAFLNPNPFDLGCTKQDIQIFPRL